MPGTVASATGRMDRSASTPNKGIEVQGVCGVKNPANEKNRKAPFTLELSVQSGELWMLAKKEQHLNLWLGGW